ncbi:MAG: glycosyltransferase family 9 protein [Oligoflexia bacterium]
MKPIRCVVVQLGRGSDLLESLLALRAAQQLYPLLELTLVCREEFAELPQQAEWLKEVVALPTQDWVSSVTQGTSSVQEAMGPAARAISPLIGNKTNDESWDLLVNWSYSEASSYLAALLPAKLKLGYSRRSQSLDFSSGDAWSQYIHGAVQGALNPGLHLTDMLTTQLLTALQIQQGDPADVGNQSATGRNFFSRSVAGDPILDPSRVWIGIQADSFYKAPEWASLIKNTLERHPEVHVAILGDEKRKALAREIVQTCTHEGLDPRRMVNLAGETDAELWIDVVSQCRWMIACSPLPAQLASLLGTRVLQLSHRKNPSSIQAAYGNQHLLLSTTDDSVPLAPEAVYAAWSFGHYERIHHKGWNFERHLEQLGFTSLMEWTELRRSRIRPGEEGGGVVYDSVFSRPMETHEWLALVHAQIARQWYCGWTAQVGSELNRQTIGPRLLQDLRALSDSSEVLLRVLSEAVRTSEQFQAKGSGLKSEKLMSVSDRQELEKLGRKLLELQKLIERLAAADTHLSLFSAMLTVMLHNLQGEQIAEISKETLLSFKQLEQGAELLRMWIKHTLKMARPAAVAPLSLVPIP